MLAKHALTASTEKLKFGRFDKQRAKMNTKCMCHCGSSPPAVSRWGEVEEVEKANGSGWRPSILLYTNQQKASTLSLHCQRAWASLLAVFFTSEIAWKQDALLTRLSDGLLGLFCILVLAQV